MISNQKRACSSRRINAQNHSPGLLGKCIEIFSRIKNLLDCPVFNPINAPFSRSQNGSTVIENVVTNHIAFDFKSNDISNRYIILELLKNVGIVFPPNASFRNNLLRFSHT